MGSRVELEQSSATVLAQRLEAQDQELVCSTEPSISSSETLFQPLVAFAFFQPVLGTGLYKWLCVLASLSCLVCFGLINAAAWSDTAMAWLASVLAVSAVVLCILTWSGMDSKVYFMVMRQFDFLYLGANVVVYLIGTVWSFSSNPESWDFCREPSGGGCSWYAAVHVALFGLVFGAGVLMMDSWLIPRRFKIAALVFCLLILIREIVLVWPSETAATSMLCVSRYCFSHVQLRLASLTTIATFMGRYIVRAIYRPDRFIFLKSAIRYDLISRPKREVPAPASDISESRDWTEGQNVATDGAVNLRAGSP